MINQYPVFDAINELHELQSALTEKTNVSQCKKVEAVLTVVLTLSSVE